MRLYIAGGNPRSKAAQENLKRICDEHLAGKYFLEVVDVHESPHMAERDRIFAIPTVIRKNPGPPRKIIGDLSRPDQVIIGLGLPNH